MVDQRHFAADAIKVYFIGSGAKLYCSYIAAITMHCDVRNDVYVRMMESGKRECVQDKQMNLVWPSPFQLTNHTALKILG